MLGLSPQILVLIAYLLWGVVGLLLTDFARPMRIGVQVAGAALLLLTELLLVTGVRETGSAVSWTILTYALEVAELAADGAWLVTPAVVLLGIVWFSVVSLGAFGRHRRAALALSTAGVMLTGLSVLGAPVSRLPRYMSVDALVYLVHSRSAVPDDQRAELRARPVSTGMALEDGLPNGRNVVVVFLESVGANAVTPYTPDLPTTPFLEELSHQSVFRRAGVRCVEFDLQVPLGGVMRRGA